MPAARGHLGCMLQQRTDGGQSVADAAGAAGQGQDDGPVEDSTQGAGEVSGGDPLPGGGADGLAEAGELTQAGRAQGLGGDVPRAGARSRRL